MLHNQPFYLENQKNKQHACLLMHGLGGGPYEMQLLGHYLHRNGHTVKGITYPGHDVDTHAMPDSSWQEWYAHSVEAYDMLRKSHESVSLIGFSTGCPLALKLASLHPVEKLVLLSPFLRVKQDWFCPLPPERMIPQASRILKDLPRLRKLPIKDRNMAYHANQASYFRTFNLSCVQSALDLIELITPQLPDIHNPTLIIQSTSDSVVDPSGAEQLMQSLGSEQKEILWLSRSNHVITLDVDRQAVFERVESFIDNAANAPIKQTPQAWTEILE